MNYEHSFIICAYKESPYLEQCIQSLIKQSVKSKIKIVTSTPNEHILKLAQKYEIEYLINTETKGISEDWNFAYKQADTPFMTIAHQDDIYLPEYTFNLISMVKKVHKPLIFFTDYAEIRESEICKKNELLKVKRLMLLPLSVKFFWTSKWLRRRILSLGSPICCPSVAFCKQNLPDKIFEQHFRSCEDWEAWEKLSRYKGGFIYCKKILTYHRIHGDSETTAIIRDNARSDEEFEMYKKFWPDFIAKILVKVYARGQKSNDIK